MKGLIKKADVPPPDKQKRDRFVGSTLLGGAAGGLGGAALGARAGSELGAPGKVLGGLTGTMVGAQGGAALGGGIGAARNVTSEPQEDDDYRISRRVGQEVRQRTET